MPEQLILIPTQCAENYECRDCKVPQYALGIAGKNEDPMDFVQRHGGETIMTCERGQTVILNSHGFIYVRPGDKLDHYPEIPGIGNSNSSQAGEQEQLLADTEKVTTPDGHTFVWNPSEVKRDAIRDVAKRWFGQNSL